MKFKVGQRVRVINSLHGHKFEIGDVVLIQEITEEDDYSLGDYDCVRADGMRWFLTEDEVETVSEKEEQRS